MTNSYNLSQRPKIVFFHGLNNNVECFGPLVDHFKQQGFETEMIVLPGHGEDRSEAKDFKRALRCFDQSMRRLRDTTYYAIAFSHGALYLQLWLEKNQEHKPLRQILLAPALYIHRQRIIQRLIPFLPSFLVIKSLAPRKFRRYEILSVGEYNTLVQGMLTYQKIKTTFKIPTLILIDPKDELVNAPKLKEVFSETVFIDRPYLKKGLGCHHILFDPDYFSAGGWSEFTKRMEAFLGITHRVSDP